MVPLEGNHYAFCDLLAVPSPRQELDFLARPVRRVFGGYWAVAASASRAAAGTAVKEIVARARKIIQNHGNGRVMPGSPLSTLGAAELKTITTQALLRAARWWLDCGNSGAGDMSANKVSTHVVRELLLSMACGGGHCCQ